MAKASCRKDPIMATFGTSPLIILPSPFLQFLLPHFCIPAVQKTQMKEGSGRTGLPNIADCTLIDQMMDRPVLGVAAVTVSPFKQWPSMYLPRQRAGLDPQCIG